jgi:uracil DNA glycosylase
MSKLDFTKGFSEQFHESWHSKMKPVIESPEVYEIFQHLKKESLRGKKLTPRSQDLFKSFQVDLNKLKVVVVGMDSYSNFRNNKPCANGIAFDCSLYGKVSPSLEKLYEALRDDCYRDRQEEVDSFVDWNNLSLQYLVDQGVMLTNAGLCTEKDKPGKYIDLWRPFWKLVYEQVFATEAGLIFIYLGREAQKLREFNIPFSHHLLMAEHPVAASYQEREMRHENVFSKANLILKNNNGEQAQIEWLDILPF